MIIKPLYVVIFLVTVFSFQKVDAKPKKNFHECLSTREFITTLNFLRKHTEFAIKEKDAVYVADQVSQGCTGAAKRFIQVTNLLTKAKLATKQAIETALKFALASPAETKTFIIIFKEAFLKKYLDLDLMTSVNLAVSLSIDSKGDAKKYKKDFQRLVEFCISTENLDLPKPRCAQMSSRITKLGKDYKKGSSEPFIELYRFLISTDDGPSLPTFDALKVAEEVIGHGPAARKNFRQAYKYATSESGLDFDKSRAIKFARKMASRSIKKDKPSETHTKK